MMKEKRADNGPMLNAYPDSMGGTLAHIISCLQKPDFQDVFQSFYILPSIYHSDLDRGFSVIDYGLNEQLADRKDLENLKQLGLDLKLDFILNHASVLSSQFQDLIQNGQQSKYKDFFINWNQFWEGCGEMTKEGYIQPRKELIQNMFFRKQGLPILMVRFPDGSNVPYWNTFYQEINYDQNGQIESYRGQMDLNIKSPLVWEFYDKTLKTLAEYGAKIVRLDAFAYAPKEVGKKNFLNEPETWELLSRVQTLADKYQLELLPEIHASYEEKIYERLAKKGYMTYDFFLPGLIIDAFERKSGDILERWAKELKEKKIKTVNMLGCHDGIPLLDLKGLLEEEQIQLLIDRIVARGGYVKNLHGQKNTYYQVNATYYSALGEDDAKMLLARAIQLFMPGKPQVWYLDLLAGKNDYDAVERAGVGGHKEINRTNLTTLQIEERLQWKVVQKQMDMLRFRNTFPAFGYDADMTINTRGACMEISWENQGYQAALTVDFANTDFKIYGRDKNGKIVYHLDE